MGGADPGLISTDTGQVIAWAVEKAYWEQLRFLRQRGYTVAQVASWWAGDGKSNLLALAAWYWSIPVDGYNDAAYLQAHKELRGNWDDVLAGGALFDDSGDVIDPDESSDAAASLQEEHTSRNATADNLHDYVFDWDYKQFVGSTAMDTAASGRYGNTWRSNS